MRCVATQKIGPPSSVSVPQTARKYSNSLVGLEAAMRVQPVIAHADAEADRHPVEEHGDEQVRPAELKQRDDGLDVKPDQDGAGDELNLL